MESEKLIHERDRQTDRQRDRSHLFVWIFHSRILI